jgi:hypothetical protein
VCVFLKILWFCHISDHLQGHLAMLGYRPATKVENLLKSFYISG